MSRLWIIPLMLIGGILPMCEAFAAAPPATGPVLSTADRQHNLSQPRVFDFIYAGEIDDLPSGSSVRIWLPVAQTSAFQQVEIQEKQIPAAASISREPIYGNQILYFQSTPDAASKISFAVHYRITRLQGVATPDAKPEDDAFFLKPSAFVPVGGKPASLLAGRSLAKNSMQLGRQLYDLVDDYLTYGKNKPGWGRGDANWICDSRQGNCTDFHSLFMSLCRTEGVPVKFEMGFSLPAARGQGAISGYHCWAWFKPADGQWTPVDISEANKDAAMRDYYFGRLSTNRIAFSAGRDLVLAPQQEGPKLNYFIYPYAELGGKPIASDKIKMNCSYRDLPAAHESDPHDDHP